MILVDFRAVVRHLKVRVAGTPSPYPSVFAFPETFSPEIAPPRLIPPEAILGYHDFDCREASRVRTRPSPSTSGRS